MKNEREYASRHDRKSTVTRTLALFCKVRHIKMHKMLSRDKSKTFITQLKMTFLIIS